MKSKSRIVILKSNYQTIQGVLAEDQEEEDSGHQHDMVLPLSFYFFEHSVLPFFRKRGCFHIPFSNPAFSYLFSVHLIYGFGSCISAGSLPIFYQGIKIIDAFFTHDDLGKAFSQQIVQGGTVIGQFLG